MKDIDSSSQTAYQSNASSCSFNSKVNDHGWTEAINRMIDRRYAFLALEYENEGYIFRGMSSGFFEALLENRIWHYKGEDRGNHFEQELNILLLSQDFSDAFTVSKLWEQKKDACIIVFESEVFNDALNQKKAAMMATAEPGVVFKYPFLTKPLTIGDIKYFIISPDLFDIIEKNRDLSSFCESKDFDLTQLRSLISSLQKDDRLLIPKSDIDYTNRSVLEAEIINALLEKGISGAQTKSSSSKPTRKT